MPGSSTFGKFAIVSTIVEMARKHPINHVLDIGPGQGTYLHLLQPYLTSTEFTCVEIWSPYVEDYKLAQQYSRVIIGDARTTDYSIIPPVDVCIAGDVLEHMSFSDGRSLVDRLLTKCDVVIGSVPAHHHPQDAHLGNPWEAHVEEDYTEEAMREHLPCIIDYIRDNYIGVAFMASKHKAALKLQNALVETRRLMLEDATRFGPTPDFDYEALNRRTAAALGKSLLKA